MPTNNARFYAKPADGGYRVCDGATGQYFPQIHRYWTSANFDAQRRERGAHGTRKLDRKHLQATIKLA